jgi:hypothetical protein
MIGNEYFVMKEKHLSTVKKVFFERRIKWEETFVITGFLSRFQFLIVIYFTKITILISKLLKLTNFLIETINSDFYCLLIDIFISFLFKNKSNSKT